MHLGKPLPVTEQIQHTYTATKLLFRGVEYRTGNVMIIDQPNASQLTIGKIQSLLVKCEDLFLLVSQGVCLLVPTMELYAYEEDLNHGNLVCLPIYQFADYCPIAVYHEAGTNYLSLRQTFTV